MKILASSLRRLVTEHRLETFAIIPNHSQHPETQDSSTIRDQQDVLSKYPGVDLEGMKLTGDDWTKTSRFRIISNDRDPDEEICDCRIGESDYEFVKAVLDHCERAGASGFLYHQHGQMALWWIETAERMRGFEIERFDDLVKIIVGKEGWKIEGLKYAEPSSSTAMRSGGSSRGARGIEGRFENISEWLKAIGVQGRGRGAGTKKGRATR